MRHAPHPYDQQKSIPWISNPMSKKRRMTNASSGVQSRPAKQRKHLPSESRHPAHVVKHALLAQYYPKILTLRQYILDNLPASSRIRRRKIETFGTNEPTGDPDDVRVQLAGLLDTTLVSLHVYPEEVTEARSKSHLQQWVDYSQKDDSRVTLSSSNASAIHYQSEIVDFIIWLLFSREKSPSSRPHHLLCDGFRKTTGPRQYGAPSSIQGLFSLYFNERVAIIKQAPWPQLLQLLGKSGESMMINLLLDCSIFLSIRTDRDNYYQLSGTPIFECEPTAGLVKQSTPFERKPTEIVFIRSRMMYARPALNARGLVQFGFRHIHALNRFPLDTTDNTVRIMMYIFPRQFGLHNVFTSHVDLSKTAQKLQDYTLREEEISTKFRKVATENKHFDVHIPKRLRGKLQHLVQRLQTFHARCSYAELLRHYCPVTLDENSQCYNSSAQTGSVPANRLLGKVSGGRKKPRQSALPQPKSDSLTELASPISQVSAFCQAVLSKIVPHEFWGLEEIQHHNRKTFLRNVDRFVKLRRFEAASLHEVMQGLKITEIDWLAPPGLDHQKCSRTDFRKRSELFHEFVYYVFDSLLIPLIRCNFYVTESNVHRYRVFYFRHDVWKSIAEPAMAELKVKMFDEVKLNDALRILNSRRFSYSQVRLLPKQTSVRPIMNLRRRMMTTKDKKILGQSINNILGPVYNMLKLEKGLHTNRLGSAMFSVGDIYKRISKFKQGLSPGNHPFYFAKVDVQAAFDTIPQEAIIALMRSVPSQARYEMIKHIEVQPNDNGTLANSTIMKRWHSSTKAADDKTTFLERITRQTVSTKKNTVYIDSVFRKAHSTRDLLALMTSHIQQNLVKIGKKYYRQKDGIPQGSVISSMLCSYFYADLERTHLQFLQAEDDCLLLRLIDDFLLITLDRSKAARFVMVMQSGLPEYGVAVGPRKTLVNFSLTGIDGTPVPTIQDGNDLFPYCGTQINTKTLEMTKDRGLTTSATLKDPTLANALTVEYTRRPGANFTRKVLNAFRLQSHIMFFDARHNSPRTVLTSLHDALTETAAKAWAYARCLPLLRQPSPVRWCTTVSELIGVVYLLLTSRSRRSRHPGYECRVTIAQVRWLTLGAFRKVLGRKQAKFGQVLAWLDEEMSKLEAKKKRGRSGLSKGVQALV